MPRSVLPKNPTKPPKRTWKRHEDEFGEVHYTDSTGHLRIDKHVVDDREFDGGYLTTTYYLYLDNELLVDCGFDRLKDAKRYVELYY